MSVKTKLARQAVKTTAKHTARGTASKFTRRPMRNTTLLGVGAVIGGLIGWMIGRSGSSSPEPVAPVRPTASGAVNGTATETTPPTGVIS